MLLNISIQLLFRNPHFKAILHLRSIQYHYFFFISLNIEAIFTPYSTLSSKWILTSGTNLTVNCDPIFFLKIPLTCSNLQRFFLYSHYHSNQVLKMSNQDIFHPCKLYLVNCNKISYFFIFISVKASFQQFLKFPFPVLFFFYHS